MSLRTEKTLVSVALAAILGPLFFHVSALTAARSIPPPPWLITQLDQHLPLVPAAVWVYVSWYPICAIGLLGGRTTLRRTYSAYPIAFVACLAGYLALPVTISRPNIPQGDGLSVAMLRNLYALDPPVNVFPSFHAAVAAILWRLRPVSLIPSAAVTVWTIALCAACVLTRQHYVLDVVAGLIVGGFAVTVGDVVLRAATRSVRLVSYTIGTARSETVE